MYTLESFKKANKARREKMAKNAGFSSVKSYLIHLIGDPPTTKEVEDKVVPTDYLVAFDTTGSMSTYIGNVKKHVQQLIPTLFSNIPNLRLRIVAFGDYCDMENPQVFGKAYQQSDFTDDQEHLKYFIQSAENTNGGDSDEFYELVIKKITEETPWRANSNRTVLLIGDCSPHLPTYVYGGRSYNIDWMTEAKAAAKIGIKFDTLSLSGASWYKSLSAITDGVHALFQSSGKTIEAIQASAYFRGAGSGSTDALHMFKRKAAEANMSGDKELIGLYKSFTDKL